MEDDDFDAKADRAAERMQKIGGQLTLWVTLPIVILIVVAFCAG